MRDRSNDDVIDDVHDFIVAEKLEKQCGIVFCLTRADSKKMARELKVFIERLQCSDFVR